MDPQGEGAPDLDYLLGSGAGDTRNGVPADPDQALFEGQPSSANPPTQQGTGSGSTQEGNTQGQTQSQSAAQTSRKRPLDDKKARDKKRILRNRELARVSNERRKGRIKAMETELEDTRKTVSNLEESIRSLEAENNDLKALLENRSAGTRL